ncbi:MAG TPA: MerR family transcriptional regulator [Caproiciproducens sp.]|nr:MerR family transcriptional regulator [Caproiciproducens sp.]
MKINEVAKLTGVTVRTLHYYDEIGLLKPAEVTESGYRLYDSDSLCRLQQILLLRELDFPLDEIQEILKNPAFDQTDALKKHRELLIKKREHFDDLIGLVDKIMKGENTLSFQEFDQTEMENMKKQYAAEVKERWGSTDAYREYEEKSGSYDEPKWQQIGAEGDAILKAFAQSRNKPADSAEVQALVKQWQDYITARFYSCTDEILAGLGQMYTGDERFKKNIDRNGSGTAEFMAKAIAVYCNRDK